MGDKAVATPSCNRTGCNSSGDWSTDWQAEDPVLATAMMRYEEGGEMMQQPKVLIITDMG